MRECAKKKSKSIKERMREAKARIKKMAKAQEKKTKVMETVILEQTIIKLGGLCALVAFVVGRFVASFAGEEMR